MPSRFHLHKMHFKFNNIHTLEIKYKTMVYIASFITIKLRVMELISAEINISTKIYYQRQIEIYIMLEGTYHQEDI